MKADRVVLDTNVFVSLILNQGLHELVVWSKDYKATIYTCPELLTELKDVLNRVHISKHLTEAPVVYIRFIQSITTEQTIDLRFDRAPDLKDNYLFDLAYTVKSYYLVTRDKPLLNMKQVNKIKIVSLNDWKSIMKKS